MLISSSLVLFNSEKMISCHSLTFFAKYDFSGNKIPLDELIKPKFLRPG
jgi:hypothetical protein